MVERRLAKANVASSNLVSRSNFIYADVAELADALDLGSSIYDVGVQVSSSAPLRAYTNTQTEKPNFRFLFLLRRFRPRRRCRRGNRGKSSSKATRFSARFSD